MKEEKTKIEITNPAGIKLDYDDISPFTGNKCVLIEADENTNSETTENPKSISQLGSQSGETSPIKGIV